MPEYRLRPLPREGMFQAADDYALAVWKRAKMSDVICKEMTVPRSTPMHRRYFGLLSMVFENSEWASERWPTLDRFREAVQMQAGHFTEGVSMNGSKLYLPESISYSRLDQTEFAELYHRVREILLTRIPEWQGVTPEELEQMLDEYQRL